jgi:squalene-hopene/tetraprenyl-beta-curcumene cyclase
MTKAWFRHPVIVGVTMAFGWALGQEHRTAVQGAEPAQPLPALAPARADEPVAEQLSLAKAADFLDQVSVNWTTERKCGSCHTNYPYLLARPTMPASLPSPPRQVRDFFEDRAAHWDTSKPRWDTEVVATASALAFNDAELTGKLHPLTRGALDRMWSLQRADGSWDWLKCDWHPAETDDYYGVLVAALGVGIAPDGYARTPAAQAGLKKIEAYLDASPPPNLHHQAMRLWASTRLPELMPAKQRQDTIAKLLALQRADGGWSLPSLGDWKRRSGAPNDKVNAPSDGYATGLVVYILRQAGLAADYAAIAKGVAWLRTNQRASGRWFTRSLNDDRDHFIAHAGTAYAVMALRACGVE